MTPRARFRLATHLSVLPLLAALACGPKGGPATTVPDASAAAAASPAATTRLAIDEARMFADLEHLAKDELQGRYTMAPELLRAAEYVAASHRAAGIAPVGTDYMAPFPLVTGARADGPQTLALVRKGKESPVDAAVFTPVSSSASGSAEGEVVFVGYAARSRPRDDGEGDANAPTAETEAEVEYDDLAGVDVKGKIALVLMDAPGTPNLRELFGALQAEAESFEEQAEPLRAKKDAKGMEALHVDIRKRIGTMVEPFLRGEKLDKSFFAAPDEPLETGFNLMEVMRPIMELTRKIEGPQFGQRAGSMRAKVRRLKDAGAVGVIAVRGPRSFVKPEARDADELEDLADAGVSRGDDDLGLPVVQVRWKAADKLLRVKGKKLSQLQKAIDMKLRPKSGPTGLSAKLTTKVAPIVAEVPNVLGMIEGTDLKDEIVLLGAHYDHIGNAENGRCGTITDDDGNKDSICNGADDNASGSAMVMELARAMKEAGYAPRRTLVFAHFAGEELGLYGSAALAENPPPVAPFAGDKVVAMVNLDMVGRLGPKGLAIGGLSSSDQWMPMLDEIGNHGMKVLYERSIASRSDQANFYKKEIPVLFFFTNVHLDYHRATDHSDKIDREGMQNIGEMVAAIMVRLGDGTAIQYAAPRTENEGLNSALPGQTKGTVEKRVKSDGTEM